MEEYKGIYYGDESERKFFEGGAHFKYSKLYRILEKLAKERNGNEKQKELYVHKKNILSNNNLNRKRMTKDKKSRNIVSYLDSNKVSYNTLSINNNAINKNDSFNYHHQTYISINNKLKNKIKRHFSIKNQKKMLVSRNKNSLLLFKGRPNTILKEELQNILFKRKNNLISSSMDQKKNKNNFFSFINHKRSLPELNNNKISFLDKKTSILSNKSNKILKHKEYISINEIQNTSSYIEVNKIGLKTERFNTLDTHKELDENNVDISDIKNKSQYNFNRVNYMKSLEVNKKTQPKIKNKNMEKNKNNIIKERTKSNFSSDMNEKNSLKNNLINKERKEIVNNKLNKKKNIKQNFIIHNNTFLTKINFNNQFMRIINEPNKPNKIKLEKMKTNNNFSSSNKKLDNKKKIDKSFLNKFNLTQSSYIKFIGKSRNLNGMTNSNNLKNSFVNKSSLFNSNLSKNIDKFKKNFQTMAPIDKIPTQLMNNKSNRSNNSKINFNNKTIQNNLDLMNKSTPKINKKIFTILSSGSNNVHEMSKSKLIIKPYAQIKVNNNVFKSNMNKIINNKVEQSINNNNNIPDLKIKKLNNNKIKNGGVYIKPKQSQCCLKKNTSNNNNDNNNTSSNINLKKIESNIISFNKTQKPLVKKKAIIKFSK